MQNCIYITARGIRRLDAHRLLEALQLSGLQIIDKTIRPSEEA